MSDEPEEEPLIKQKVIIIDPTDLEKLETGDMDLMSRFPKTIAPEWSAHAELICGVCDGLLENPVTIHPCGHSACSGCMEVHLQTYGAVCPVCDILTTELTS